MQEAAEEAFPRAQPQPRKTFISDNTFQLVLARNQIERVSNTWSCRFLRGGSIDKDLLTYATSHLYDISDMVSNKPQSAAQFR